MQRFKQFTSEEVQMETQQRIPKNTINKMNWAMNIFKLWLCQWRTRLDNDLKVLKDIQEFVKGDLDFCLAHFFAEVRKTSGEMYPPETLKSIACMIQLYFRTKHEWSFSFFNDAEFKRSRNSLDAQMKKSAREGNVKPRKRALPITFSDENELWNNGTFGSSSPVQLLHTLIFYLGLHCSLRAAQEHRYLEFGQNSQLTLRKDQEGEEYLEYVERISKNKRFGINSTRMEPKVTRICPNLENPSRCVLKLYKEYINRRPSNAGNSFYLTPASNATRSDVWYKRSPLGVHSIEKTTKLLMKSLAKENEFYSNTSLRRTAICRP